MAFLKADKVRISEGNIYFDRAQKCFYSCDFAVFHSKRLACAAVQVMLH